MRFLNSEVPLYVGSIQHLKDLTDEVRDKPTRSVSSREDSVASDYRGTSLIRKCTPLGPHRGPMPGVPRGSQEGGRLLMGEVPLSGLRTSHLVSSHRMDTVWPQTSRSTGVPRLSENAPPLGPYDRPIPRALRLSYGGGAVFS